MLVNFDNYSYKCPNCGNDMLATVEIYEPDGMRILSLTCNRTACDWPTGPFMWALSNEAVENKGGLKNAFDELYKFAENSYLDWRIAENGWKT